MRLFRRPSSRTAAALREELPSSFVPAGELALRGGKKGAGFTLPLGSQTLTLCFVAQELQGAILCSACDEFLTLTSNPAKFYTVNCGAGRTVAVCTACWAGHTTLPSGVINLSHQGAELLASAWTYPGQRNILTAFMEHSFLAESELPPLELALTLESFLLDLDTAIAVWEELLGARPLQAVAA